MGMIYNTSYSKGKCEGKGHPRTGYEGPQREQIYNSTLPSPSAPDGGGWSTSRPGRFTTGNDPVPIVQVTGWVPGPVWTDAENLVPTGIRSPVNLERSESLYRLNYPDPHTSYRTTLNFKILKKDKHLHLVSCCRCKNSCRKK